MLSRRKIMMSAGAASLIPLRVFGASPDWLKQLEERLRDDQDPVFLGRKQLPITSQEWQEGQDLIDAAPTNVTPYKIAEYFKESVPKKFQEAWSNSEYANPVVVEFFWATKTKPAGDTTAWCAAFVNWCLTRAGLPATKQGASSQSFVHEDWGQEVWKKGDGPLEPAAQKGDIAVFRHPSDPAHGHACFFKQTSGSGSVEVLGGNEIHGHVHLIDFDILPIHGRDFELYSIRTADGVRDV